jgi:hypothetical protein
MESHPGTWLGKRDVVEYMIKLSAITSSMPQIAFLHTNNVLRPTYILEKTKIAKEFDNRTSSGKTGIAEDTCQCKNIWSTLKVAE